MACVLDGVSSRGAAPLTSATMRRRISSGAERPRPRPPGSAGCGAAAPARPPRATSSRPTKKLPAGQGPDLGGVQDRQQAARPRARLDVTPRRGRRQRASRAAWPGRSAWRTPRRARPRAPRAPAAACARIVGPSATGSTSGIAARTWSAWRPRPVPPPTDSPRPASAGTCPAAPWAAGRCRPARWGSAWPG